MKSRGGIWRTLIIAIAVSLLWIVVPATRAATVPAGHDLLETDSGTTLQYLSLPSDFFGPGSDPFEGQVCFAGLPFDCFDPDGGPGPEPTYCDLRPTDTIVRRLADAGPTFPATVPIEIVALSLESCAPITVTFNGGLDPSTWDVTARVEIDPTTGEPNPPQDTGSMQIRLEHANGGTFDSTLPVLPFMTFVRTDVPGTIIGPILSPFTLFFDATGEPWCDHANPLGFPPDHIVVQIPGLTTDFFPGVLCTDIYPAHEPPVSFSVDGGAFNPARNGAPLTPLPNPTEGLIVPDPRHVAPNDVYALGTSPGVPPGAPPGGQGYATEGEVFQAAGFPLGNPVNQTNVDRMSASLGIGPAPSGPPFMGAFQPNPGGSIPAPPPPGVAGPPGAFGPPPGHAVGVLGLVPDDNIDALSYGRDSGNVLLFSVDPATLGVPGSAVLGQSTASPFTAAAALPLPTNPGGGDPGGEAAGDIFKSVQLANFGSYIPLHFTTGRFLTPAVLAVNQLAIDELLLGLQAPALNGSAIAVPEDDLDGMEMSDTGDLVFGVDVSGPTGLPLPDGVPDRPVFFSIDTASPSMGLVLGPGIVTADDVLVTPPGGFAFAIFADGVVAIGLMAGDDIDALVVSDVAVLGGLDPGLDEALFSLHPGSPSVQVGPDGVPGTGDEVSAADVFYTSFLGTFMLYAGSATLGLQVADNLNALDIQPASLRPQPVPPPIPPTDPPGPVKKLSFELALLASHGIRVPERRPCHHFMTGEFTVEIFGFGTFVVPMEGPAEVESGSRIFDPETARSEIQTEILFMDLFGDSPFGPVFTSVGRAHGLEPSTGEITTITPGIDFPAESFFDVSIRIDLGPMVLHNQEPYRMAAIIDEIPPYGSIYKNPPEQEPVLLFDEAGQPAGLLHAAVQRSSCEVDEDCNDHDLCTVDFCDHASGACGRELLPDSDGDGLCDLADNCPQTANPGGQAPLVFGQEILALNPIEFCWPDPADVLWVRGDLDLVSTYAIDLVTPAPGAVCLIDPTQPGTDLGLYYLVTEDCPAASWQSSLGVEPLRDETILP